METIGQTLAKKDNHKYDTEKRMQEASLYQSYSNPILSFGNSLPFASFSSAYFHSASASLKVSNCPKNSFAASIPTIPLSVTSVSDASFSLIPEIAT